MKGFIVPRGSMGKGKGTGLIYGQYRESDGGGKFKLRSGIRICENKDKAVAYITEDSSSEGLS